MCDLVPEFLRGVTDLSLFKGRLQVLWRLDDAIGMPQLPLENLIHIT